MIYTITIDKKIQSEILITTMEKIVPEDSLFRKIDKYIDFTFIYDGVKYLYCNNNGRHSIDPVVLLKLVFIQALDGIKSMRKTCEKLKWMQIKINMKMLLLKKLRKVFLIFIKKI